MRDPRRNFDAESCVLGAIMLDPDVLLRLSLKPSDFTDGFHRTMFEIAQSLHLKGRAVDAMTIRGELEDRNLLADQGGNERLIEIMEQVPSSAHVDSYAAMVEEASYRRNLEITAGKIKAIAGDGRVKDPKAEADKVVAEVLHGASRSSKRVNYADTFQQELDRAEDAKQGRGQAARIGIGTHVVDDVAEGLERGGLYLLSARPSHGKTSFAVNAFRRYSKAGGKGAFISMEMSGEEIVMLLTASEAQVNLGRLRKAHLSSIEWGMVFKAAETLAQLNPIIERASFLDLPGLLSLIHRLAVVDDCDVIFIDYLSLVDKGDNEKTYDFTSKLSRRLKQTAQKLGIRLVVLAQLNREIAKSKKPRKPRPDDLKDSGNLEQDADGIIFLHSEEIDGPKNTISVELIVAKNRGGPKGSAWYTWHRDCCHFDEPTLRADGSRIERGPGADSDGAQQLSNTPENQADLF